MILKGWFYTLMFQCLCRCYTFPRIISARENKKGNQEILIIRQNKSGNVSKIVKWNILKHLG